MNTPCRVVLAWQFTRQDGTTPHTPQKEEVGKTYCHKEGLRGSIHALDALMLGHGLFAKRVSLRGKIAEDIDVVIAYERTPLAEVDATAVVFEWLAEDVIQRALARIKNTKTWLSTKTRQRLRSVIEILHEVAEGKVNADKLAKAKETANRLHSKTFSSESVGILCALDAVSYWCERDSEPDAECLTAYYAASAAFRSFTITPFRAEAAANALEVVRANTMLEDRLFQLLERTQNYKE